MDFPPYCLSNYSVGFEDFMFIRSADARKNRRMKVSPSLKKYMDSWVPSARDTKSLICLPSKILCCLQKSLNVQKFNFETFTLETSNTKRMNYSVAWDEFQRFTFCTYVDSTKQVNVWGMRELALELYIVTILNRIIVI